MSKREEEYRLGYNSGYAKGYEAAEQKRCCCHPRRFRSLQECKREIDALCRSKIHTLVVPDDLYYDYKNTLAPGAKLQNVNVNKENLMYMGITLIPETEYYK